MIHLVTFCAPNMTKAAELCVRSAGAHGADRALIYPQDALRRTQFYKDNQSLLDQPRGAGYFAWKPFIISEEMEGACDGDILIYLDAGVETINNLNYIIDRMDQDIFLFGNMWEHAHWCKRDIIDAIMPGAPWEIFGKQVQASAIFFRVNDQTRAFVKEWLDWCLFEDGRLIDDSPSRGINHEEFQENRYDQAILSTMAIREGIAKHWWPATYQGGSVYPRNANHPEFKENRHDQAILTTMAYRDKIPFHQWPARYCLGTPQQFDHERGHYEDDYPVLFHHHRLRNDEWSQAA